MTQAQQTPPADTASEAERGAGTIAMISSPLQALNLVEYAKAAGARIDLVLVGDGVSLEKTIPQIRAVLAELPDAAIHLRRHDIRTAGGPQWWGEMFGELLVRASSIGRPVERLLVGDIRLLPAFQLARALGLATEQIIVLDDGMATLSIDRTEGSAWERSLEQPWSQAVPDERAPRGLTLFTAYADAVRAAAEDRVIANEYGFLRSRLAGLAVDPELVVVAGSPFTEPGVDLSVVADLRVARDLIRTAQKRFPGARLVYAPHRREKADKLVILRAEVDVHEFDVPFELAPLELGALPAAVVGFHSSLLVNLARLYADFPEVAMLAVRPPEELFDPARASARAAAFDFLTQHTLGRVEVVPLPLDPAWAEHPVELAWHPGAAPLTIPLGEVDAKLSLARPAYFSALLTTVTGDADVLWLTGGVDRWRPWLGDAVAHHVRVVDSPDAIAGDKVVVFGGGSLDLDLGLDVGTLDGCPDVRVFWEDADRALQQELLDSGYRLYAVQSDQPGWEEVRHAQARVGLLYGVRKAGAHTVAVLNQWGGEEWRGAQRSHVEMVTSLIRQGHMVDTLVPVDQGLGHLLGRAGGSVTSIGPLTWWYVRPDTVAAEGTPTLADLGEPQPLLVRELDRRRPDVLLTQCGPIPDGAMAAALLGIPHVWYLREFGDLDFDCRLPGTPPEVGRMIEALSTRVLTNSACVREHFFPGRPDAATVIHPAPVIPGPHALRTSWSERTPGVLTVGVLASLEPGKGQATLIEAAALLRDRGVAVRVLLYGNGLPHNRAALEETGRRLGVSDRVHLAGLEPSRLRMYSSLDAVVVASTAEAFGRVPFEAAAFDVPVVYADVAGPAEYMRDGVTGLAFAAQDATELADALARLAAEPALREQLAVEARADLVGVERQRTLDRQLHEAVAAAVEDVQPSEERRVWGKRLAGRLAESFEHYAD